MTQIFIDESGDPGFKIKEGSSQFFIVALVIFDDDKQVVAAREKLEQLKTKWDKAKGFEFKFTKLNKSHRLEVLQTALEFDFKIRAVIFDKVKMNELQLKHFQKNYYQYALRSLLNRSSIGIENAVIKIDTFSQEYYRRNLTDYFQKHIGGGKVPVMEKLIFEDSKYDVLIQLADSVAGALRKSFERRGNDAEVYRNLIEDREEDIGVFHSVLHEW
jgi:hypothetical protein